MAKKNKNKRQGKRPETEYEELFKTPITTVPSQHESLAQPSPLKIVDSVTTYGAYEEPI